MKSQYWNALFRLGRVSNLPSVLSNVTVGYLLGGGGLRAFESSWAPWLICVVAMSCFYEAGMFLNDICDYAVDVQERPERPLPSQEISMRTAVCLMILLFLAGLALVLVFLPKNLILSFYLVGLIVIYNRVHSRFFYSPFLMGACRGMLYLMGAKAAGWEGSLLFSDSVIRMALGIGAYISAVSFIARDEVQNSLKSAVYVASISVLGVLLWPLWGISKFHWLELLGFAPIAFWVIFAQLKLFRREISISQMVGALLSGVSLWDAWILSTVSSVSGMSLAWLCFGGSRLWQKRIQAT